MLRHATGILLRKKQMTAWEAAGRPAPPPAPIKHEILRLYAKESGAKIFVETGSYMGDTIHAMLPFFEKIYSIEIFEPLHLLCRRRFKGSSKVMLIHGDSAKKLESIVSHLEKQTLFWLDGHYSGQGTGKGAKDTPILEELTHIFKNCRVDFTILIDDARCFGNLEYPVYPTIPVLRSFVEANSPCPMSFSIEDDIIRLVPR